MELPETLIKQIDNTALKNAYDETGFYQEQIDLLKRDYTIGAQLALSHKEDNSLPVEEKQQPGDLLNHIETLTEFNKWRRGEESEMRSPTDIGIAIDVCLKVARSTLNAHPAPLEVEPSEDLLSDFTAALDNVWQEAKPRVPSSRERALPLVLLAQRHAEETAKAFAQWCSTNNYEFSVYNGNWDLTGVTDCTTDELYSRFKDQNA